jgi:predicted nucleotidyltransferase
MGLINFLRKNKDSRKIFGKAELKIIEKQLNGISLTQSEKNRLSRDIRKKFEFIKEASKYSEEFNLKKGSENKKIAEEAKEVILGDELCKKVKRIILFGSIVENKASFKSDIDIAVDFSGISSEEATRFRLRAASKLPEKADIQVFNLLPDKIKKEINEKGKILYEKQN